VCCAQVERRNIPGIALFSGPALFAFLVGGTWDKVFGIFFLSRVTMIETARDTEASPELDVTPD